MIIDDINWYQILTDRSCRKSWDEAILTPFPFLNAMVQGAAFGWASVTELDVKGKIVTQGWRVIEIPCSNDDNATNTHLPSWPISPVSCLPGSLGWHGWEPPKRCWRMAAPRVARAPDPELALGPGAPRYQRTRHLPGAKLEDLYGFIGGAPVCHPIQIWRDI